MIRLGFIIFSLCLAGRAAAEPNPLILDLTGPWEARLGDDLAWAQLSTPTAEWTQVTLPEVVNEGTPSGGFAWFRRTVTIEPALIERWSGLELGIALGWGLGTAYEVYADGELIGSHGTIAPVPVGAPGESQAFGLPRRLLEDGQITLCMRTWQYARARRFVSAGYRWSADPYVLGPIQTVRTMAQANWYRRRHIVGVNVAIGFFLMSLGFFHLLAWRGRGELAAYGWYGALIIVAGLSNVFFIRGEPVWPYYSLERSALLEPFLFGFTPAVAWEYLFSFFDIRRPRWWWAFWVSCAAGWLMQLGGLDVAVPAVRVALTIWGMLGALAFASLALWSAWRGARSAQLVAAAIVAFALIASAGNLASLGLLPRWLVWSHEGIGVLPSTFALILLIGAMAVALAERMQEQLKNLDELHRASVRFVPTDFLALLGKTRVTEVVRGDAVTTTQTILFADIRGFTGISEEIGASASFALMNDYHATMEPLIVAQGGFINQYYGDGLMALFPSGEAAVAAAREMVGALSSFDSSHAPRALEIGVGVHSGPVMLGTIGGLERLDTGVISDVVNTASRLQELTKTYPQPIICSAAVRATLPIDAPGIEPLGEVVPHGKKESLEIFGVTVLGDAEPAPS